MTLSHSRQRDDLALAQIKGSPMIALSDLARLLNAVVLRPNVNGSKGDTVYLLARILSARFESDHIRITTSFPVRTTSALSPTRSRTWLRGLCRRSVSPDFKCGMLPDGETRIQKMRAGKYSDEVARVVVELADGQMLTNQDGVASDQAPISARLQAGHLPPTPSQSGKGSTVIPGSPSGVVQNPGKVIDELRATEA